MRTRGPDSDIDSDEDEDVKSVVKRPTSTAAEEYDPDVDGDAPTVIGSSSSGRIERNKVPRELFPKE